MRFRPSIPFLCCPARGLSGPALRPGPGFLPQGDLPAGQDPLGHPGRQGWCLRPVRAGAQRPGAQGACPGSRMAPGALRDLQLAGGAGRPHARPSVPGCQKDLESHPGPQPRFRHRPQHHQCPPAGRLRWAPERQAQPGEDHAESRGRHTDPGRQAQHPRQWRREVPDPRPTHASPTPSWAIQLLEQHLDLALKESKTLEFALLRISSTVTFNTFPSEAEILLDDRSLGGSHGQAPASARPMAEKLGLTPEQLSADFILSDLPPGKHILEVRAPCHPTKRIALGEEFASPFADHLLEPIQLAALPRLPFRHHQHPRRRALPLRQEPGTLAGEGPADLFRHL